MKRILDITRLSIVSPETLIIAALALIFYWAPDILEAVGEKIKSDSTMSQWLPTLPMLFTGISFQYSSKLRAPLDSGNKKLYDWFEYHRITDRLIASHILTITSSIIAISLWIFSKEINSALMGFAFTSATLVSGSVALNVFLASQKIREILEKYE